MREQAKETTAEAVKRIAIAVRKQRKDARDLEAGEKVTKRAELVARYTAEATAAYPKVKAFIAECAKAGHSGCRLDLAKDDLSDEILARVVSGLLAEEGFAVEHRPAQESPIPNAERIPGVLWVAWDEDAGRAQWPNHDLLTWPEELSNV